MKQANIKQIAEERIQTLFKQAKQISKTDPQLASQYVKSARKIAMAARISLPIEFRRETCRKCSALLVQGYNSRVRVKQKRQPHVVTTCLNCGNQTRMLLSQKKERKESE